MYPLLKFLVLQSNLPNQLLYTQYICPGIMVHATMYSVRIFHVPLIGPLHEYQYDEENLIVRSTLFPLYTLMMAERVFDEMFKSILQQQKKRNKK